MRWNGAKACRVLCINTPPEVYASLSDFLKATSTPSLTFLDPFAMLLPLFDEVIKSCDENTWAMVQEVRQVEKVWKTAAYNISNCYLKFE